MTAPQPPVGPPDTGPVPSQTPGDPESAATAQPPGPRATADPARARPPKRTGRLTAVMALVAVLAALLAAGVAGWAVHRANRAVAATEQLADRLARAPQPAAGPADPAPDAGQPSEAPATDPGATPDPTLDPQAVFEVKYEDRVLNPQLSVNGPRYIDLDAPRVNDEAGADILLHKGATSAVDIRFSDGVTAAAADAPTVTPNDCVDKIQYSPLNPTDRYSFRQGDVVCILTSQAAADARADRQRMVVVEIKAINANDIVSISASAWDVPS